MTPAGGTPEQVPLLAVGADVFHRLLADAGGPAVLNVDSVVKPPAIFVLLWPPHGDYRDEPQLDQVQDVLQAVVALVAEEVNGAERPIQSQAGVDVRDQHRHVTGVGGAGCREHRQAVVGVDDGVSAEAPVRFALVVFCAGRFGLALLGAPAVLGAGLVRASDFRRAVSPLGVFVC